MDLLKSLYDFAQYMDNYGQKHRAAIEQEKMRYVSYTDQQVLNELATENKKEGLGRSDLKIRALKKLLEERGYVYVGNGYYQKR
mgnify:CR=1 FL=1|jgi:hypothetical protein